MTNAARRAALGGATDLMPLGALPADAKKTEKSEEAEDLERLFAIRDRELSRQSGDDIGQVGYEKTRPSPL